MKARVASKIRPGAWVALAAAVLLAGSAVAQTPPPLMIATDNHPPLLQTDDAPGENQGIMTDIVRAAFSNQGQPVQFLSVPAARISWSLLEGKASAVVGPLGWFKKAAAEDQVHCIKVYPASFHFYYMKRRFPNGLAYKRLEELKGLRIGYMYGGAATAILENAGLTLEKVNHLDQNTRKLNMGRIDLMVTESVGGWASIRKIYPDGVDRFDMAGQAIMDAPGCAIFMKDRSDLIRTFQRGFDAIRHNGTYMEIVNRYHAGQRLPAALIDFR